ARAGRPTRPAREGGGVNLPPTPRDSDSGLPPRMRRVALDSALLSKFIDNEVVIIDSPALDGPKTKDVASLLKKIGVEGKATLIGTKGLDRNLHLSTRNIDRVKLDEIRNFNTLDVLRHVRLVLTKDALDELIDTRKKAAQARKVRTTDVGKADKVGKD
ncbi:MAG: 50S ribosomal protein L4, partial [Planctomycetota bacterium]